MQSTRLAGPGWVRSGVLVLAFVLTASPGDAADDASKTDSKGQLEQLVAPIALYPDSLLAQVLMASTYPLEIVEAERWIKKNPDLKGKELQDALQDQNWDPSVKSLTAFPQTLQMLNDKLDWTTQLGDAFLASQKDVMNTVQVLREKAKSQGNLESNKQQTVKVEPEPTGTQTQTIIIESANPQVVYVPTYNPMFVYGPWPYPMYRPFYWYPPGYVAATSAVSFGIGFAVGSAMWGGCNWGRSDVDININKYNNFNRTNIKNSNWKHNAKHRRGVAYGNKDLQNRFGAGQARDAKARNAFRGRAEQGRREIAKGSAGRFKGKNPGSALGGAGTRSGLKDRAGAVRRSGSGRSRSAFEGMSNSRQTRRYSNRGSSSRSRASRAGGGGGGGGRFRGGGGGRRGGGRRR